jgi:hypothetical protein
MTSVTFPIDNVGLYILPLDDVAVHVQRDGRDMVVRGSVTDMYDLDRDSIGIEVLPFAWQAVGARYIEVHTSQVRRLPTYPPLNDAVVQYAIRTARYNGIESYLTDPAYEEAIARRIGLTDIEHELRLVVERATK